MFDVAPPASALGSESKNWSGNPQCSGACSPTVMDESVGIGGERGLLLRGLLLADVPDADPPSPLPVAAAPPLALCTAAAESAGPTNLGPSSSPSTAYGSSILSNIGWRCDSVPESALGGRASGGGVGLIGNRGKRPPSMPSGPSGSGGTPSTSVFTHGVAPPLRWGERGGDLPPRDLGRSGEPARSCSLSRAVG